MTSKLSFSSLLKEDRRHRQWVPTLAGVVYFIGLLVAIMILQSLQQDLRNMPELMNPDSYATRRIANLILGGENPALIAVSVIGALICGFEGFSYLLQSREVDYYHAFPVRRETHFKVRWLNGFLFYIIPYVVFLAMSTLFTGIFGLMTDTFFKDLLIGLLENVIIFLLVYNIVIAVVMVAGQPVIAGGGVLIAAFYILAVRYVVPIYVESYFETYVNAGSTLLSKLDYVSPPLLIFNMVVRNGISYWVAAVVIAILAFVAAYMLYRIRPLEAAGSAIAFPVLKPILRVLLVLPITLYVTWGFIEAAPAAKIVWAAVSVIVFSGLIHAVIEVVFEFDLKAAFRHKIQLGACMIAAILFVCFFLADPMDMDHKIPSKDSVEEIYVNLYTGDNSYLDEESIKQNASWPNSYWGETYTLQHVKLTGENMQLAYDIIANSKSYRELMGCRQETLRVNFKMKNGTIQERKFQYGMEENAQLIMALMSCDELRSTHYQIGTLPTDVYTKMEIEDAASKSYERRFTKEEISSFVEIYRRELIARDAEQEMSEAPVGLIHLSIEMAQLPSYTIYSCDTASINWLKAHDIDLMNWTSSDWIVSAVVREIDPFSDDVYNVKELYYDGYYEEAIEESYDSPAGGFFTSAQDIPQDRYYDTDFLESFYQKYMYSGYKVLSIWAVNDLKELSMLTPYLQRYDYLESNNYQLIVISPKPQWLMEITFKDPATGNVTVESYVVDGQHLPKSMEKLPLE